MRNKIDNSLVKQFTTSENYPIGTLIGELTCILSETTIQSQGNSIKISLFGHYLKVDIREQYDAADIFSRKMVFFSCDI